MPGAVPLQAEAGPALSGVVRSAAEGRMEGVVRPTLWMANAAQPAQGAQARLGGRGAGAGRSGRRGFGAQPRLIEAPAQSAQGAHSAARRARRGAAGSPQADAGGSGRSPV